MSEGSGMINALIELLGDCIWLITQLKDPGRLGGPWPTWVRFVFGCAVAIVLLYMVQMMAFMLYDLGSMLVN